MCSVIIILESTCLVAGIAFPRNLLRAFFACFKFRVIAFLAGENDVGQEFGTCFFRKWEISCDFRKQYALSSPFQKRLLKVGTSNFWKWKGKKRKKKSTEGTMWTAQRILKALKSVFHSKKQTCFINQIFVFQKRVKRVGLFDFWFVIYSKSLTNQKVRPTGVGSIESCKWC